VRLTGSGLHRVRAHRDADGDGEAGAGVRRAAGRGCVALGAEALGAGVGYAQEAPAGSAADDLTMPSISRCCDIDSRRDHQLRQFEESML